MGLGLGLYLKMKGVLRDYGITSYGALVSLSCKNRGQLGVQYTHDMSLLGVADKVMGKGRSRLSKKPRIRTEENKGGPPQEEEEPIEEIRRTQRSFIFK